MDHDTQVELLDELLGLRKQGAAYLDESVSFSKAERYISDAQFAAEREAIFLKQPFLLAHSSELPEEGSDVVDMDLLEHLDKTWS